MNAFLLLGCFLLAVTEYVLSSAHMVPDEGLSTNRVVVYNAMSQSLDRDPPSVLIEEMPKSVKKSKKAKKTKKNKFSVIKRPPPPANCIPMGGSCKSPGKVCCDFCAFCQCRLFRTVCYCRMGNPNC